MDPRRSRLDRALYKGSPPGQFARLYEHQKQGTETMSTTKQPKQTNLRFLNGSTIPVSRAARMLKVSCQTVRRLVELGILDEHRVTPGGWIQVYYESIVDYLTHLQNGGTPEQYLDKKRAAL
jgi:hypothetical protein